MESPLDVLYVLQPYTTSVLYPYIGLFVTLNCSRPHPGNPAKNIPEGTSADALDEGGKAALVVNVD